MTDLFASHQKMTTLEPLKKRTIHGHNCLQRSVSDDDDDDDDDDDYTGLNIPPKQQ